MSLHRGAQGVPVNPSRRDYWAKSRKPLCTPVHPLIFGGFGPQGESAPRGRSRSIDPSRGRPNDPTGHDERTTTNTAFRDATEACLVEELGARKLEFPKWQAAEANR